MKNIQLWITLIAIMLLTGVGVLISVFFIAQGLSRNLVGIMDLVAFAFFSWQFVSFSKLFFDLLSKRAAWK